jgi:hypothetical protein
MVQETVKKQWRFEVNDPRQSTGWHPLWEFSEDEREAHEELADSLNRINAPIQVRIAPDED